LVEKKVAARIKKHFGLDYFCFPLFSCFFRGCVVYSFLFLLSFSPLFPTFFPLPVSHFLLVAFVARRRRRRNHFLFFSLPPLALAVKYGET
jgi:hypothetical protein